MALMCSYCSKELAGKVVCEKCADHNDCVSTAEVNEIEATAKGDASGRISAWLDREMLLKDLPQSIVPHFQRLIEDLEAGDA